MAILDACSGLNAGLPVIACLSAEASYLPSYILLVVLFAIIFFRLNREPTRERLASSLFATSIMGLLFAAGSLVPDRALGILVVLTVGSGILLITKS